MRTCFYILTTLAVIALAFWAYRENYATQAALGEVRELRTEIRAAHQRLSVLRAEWAYLNRPDRLRDLADINFDRLGLLPLHPSQFGDTGQISYPPDPIIDISGPVELADATEGAKEAQP